MDRNNTVSRETCCIPAGVITEPDVSLQLEGKADKEFALERVISSWRHTLLPAQMLQFSARCKELVLTGHDSLRLSDWWSVRYSDGGTGTHSWSVMFGWPIWGRAAKTNNNSTLMSDIRVKCVMMCLWREKNWPLRWVHNLWIFTPPGVTLFSNPFWWCKHPGVVPLIRWTTTVGSFPSLSWAPFESL